ncbi:hypothetical protein BD779DRAFT_1522085, partial [Infundibulicybe gibba]
MAPLPPGEPHESPKPQPIGSMPLLFLLTTCTICLLYLLWRRADSLKSAVSHQLKTWTHTEGRIRLSEDDGPPAREFIEDDDDDDGSRDEQLGTAGAEPLTGRAPQAGPNDTTGTVEERSAQPPSS